MASALLIDRLVAPDSEVALSATPVQIPRCDLQKRRWRAVAEDGSELAFALPSTKAEHGSLLAFGEHLFVVRQVPEEVVTIALSDDPSLASKIGWYLGNRHIPIEVRGSEILVENFPTLTDALVRIGIPYGVRQDILNCPAHSEHRH